MDYPVDGVTPTSSVTTPGSSTPPPQASASIGPKILSRNSNGTLVLTQTPNNEAELQLYRVMQRASLLAYYDTLLEMGGDDVRQLCEAGEEEFLEIMALVGMASKPLHVRRLQKALQEWLTNPAMFQTPLLPAGFPSRVVPSTPCVAPPSPNQSSPGPSPFLKQESASVVARCGLSPSPSPNTTQSLGNEVASSAGSPGRGPASSTSPGPSPGSPLQLTPVLIPSQISRLADAAQNLIKSIPHLEPKANSTKKKACKDLENVLAMAEDDPQRMDQIRKYAAIYGRFDCKRKPEKPLTLHEVSVNEAAAQICRLVPALLTRRDELFPLARQVVRDSGYHYSKGHSKSYSVSQGTRSMLVYSNGDQAAKRQRLEGPHSDLNDEALRVRRQERLEQIAEELRSVNERTEDLLGSTVGSFRETADIPAIHFQMEALQGRQAQLLLEQSELIKQSQSQTSLRYYRHSGSYGRVSSSFESDRHDTDDTDSQLSFSNASSPSQEVGDSRDSLTREAEAADPLSPGKQKQNGSDDELRVVNEMVVIPSKHEPDEYDDPYFQENKVQVIASSGGNIIAVANPALSMSPAIADSVLLKKESISPKLSS